MVSKRGWSLKLKPWWFGLERKAKRERAGPTWAKLEVSTMVVQFREKSQWWKSKAHLGWVWTEGLEIGKDPRVRSISSWLMVVACDAHVAVSGGLWRSDEERRWELCVWRRKKKKKKTWETEKGREHAHEVRLMRQGISGSHFVE